MKGSPHSAMFATRRQAIVSGSWFAALPIERRSWLWWCRWINDPAHINSRALNIA